MRIAVCDDDKSLTDDLKRYIYEYAGLHRFSLAVDEFADGESLLRAEVSYDIIFLDYIMKGIDGLATARKLRERNDDCVIVFLTNYPNFIYEAFEVSAFRFLKKPLDKEKLNRTLDDYFKPFLNQHSILLKFNKEIRSIRINDIVFIGADNKNCYIHLVKETLHYSNTMASVERRVMGNYLCRISKAFIVNMNYVDRFDNTYAYMKNREKLPIGRRYAQSFKAAYTEFLKN